MTNEDYINYRIDRAYEALEDAKLLAENERWNTAVIDFIILHFMQLLLC